MNRLFVLAFLCPTVAFAQSQTSVPSTAPPPVSVGTPHTCGQKDYPPIAARLGLEGTTTLTFRIGVDGRIKDVAVSRSSGSIYLDYAAVVCTASWLYKPAMQNGQPVETPWNARVEWRLISGSVASTPPVEAGAPHTCLEKPQDAANIKQPSVIAYSIGINGSAANVQILQSSGDHDADVYGSSCVSQWKFVPAKNGSVDVPVEKFVTLNWN